MMLIRQEFSEASADRGSDSEVGVGFIGEGVLAPTSPGRADLIIRRGSRLAGRSGQHCRARQASGSPLRLKTFGVHSKISGSKL
jgi:hypothetical protein